jgi:putative FmdB family regulatory protein
MPVYEYTCIECDKTKEIKRSIVEEEYVIFCESCSNSMIRSWTVPSVQFKGSGFYSNDKGQ